MKKFSQVGCCCITVGLQFPPEVPTIQVGYTFTLGPSVLIGQFGGPETIQRVFSGIEPYLDAKQRFDAQMAIQNLLLP
jgi:hypothetical protein